MILKVSELQRLVGQLDGEKYILVEDEKENEYILDTVGKRSQGGSNPNWYYAFKLVSPEGNGCMKR